MGGLPTGTHGTRQDERSGTSSHGGPPEALSKELSGPSEARVAGEHRRIPPLQDIRSD